jgi:4-diphosphocytidyl-2-C-methyl-D-erythritol kinase
VSAREQAAGGRSLRGLAPAKVNLGLVVGPRREADGRHELVSVMQSISLADRLTLEPAPAGGGRAGVGAGVDEVVCPGVPGPPGENLAARALAAFRAATGWDGPPLRLTIDKHIPVTAGLGGGSADAAAALRLIAQAAARGDQALLHELAVGLGADVPAQVRPGRWLATGAGELLHELPDPVSPLGVLVLPVAAQLSTAAVYAAADRLGRTRSGRFLEERRRALAGALELGMTLPRDPELLHNDLQVAAIALCPAIERALGEAREAGAEITLVSGSGPTVIGLFARGDGPAAAGRAAAALAGREPAAVAAHSIGRSTLLIRSASDPLVGNN